MTTITITEALAELKTIGKRLDAKRANIGNFLARDSRAKDPLEKSGGSAKFVEEELQSIGDLERRVVEIRTAIQKANLYTSLSVGGRIDSIANWLTWRREVAPNAKKFLMAMAAAIKDVREKAKAKGFATVSATNEMAAQAGDVVISLDEAELAHNIENMETILGELDGKLSLLNATTSITLS